MGFIAGLVGFVIVLGCFLLGAGQVLNKINRWRIDAQRYRRLEEDDEELY